MQVAGSGFSGSCTITVGGAAAAQITSNSAGTQLSATTGASSSSSAAKADVIVTCAGSSATLAQGFTYTGYTTTFGYVNTQYPCSITVTAGQPTAMIFGQVYKTGVTEATTNGANAAQILAQVGYGPPVTDPGQSAAWRWFSAAFNTNNNNCGGANNNYEYKGTLTIPSAGSYEAAYRYSFDNGLTWQYGALANACACGTSNQLLVTVQ